MVDAVVVDGWLEKVRVILEPSIQLATLTDRHDGFPYHLGILSGNAIVLDVEKEQYSRMQRGDA